MRVIAIILASLISVPAMALDLDAPFGNIDGGEIRLSEWAGQPVLVVNTASRCCEVNFGLDIPMTTITSVRGEAVHPFYASVLAETGFAPTWNFNKVLIAPDGRVAGTWGSTTRPTSGQITEKIEAMLN